MAVPVQSIAHVDANNGLLSKVNFTATLHSRGTLSISVYTDGIRIRLITQGSYLVRNSVGENVIIIIDSIAVRGQNRKETVLNERLKYY